MSFNPKLTTASKLLSYASRMWSGRHCESALPQLPARFQPPPLWLEERIREALAEPVESMTRAQFEKSMKAIADGR
jgi:hypothetical protein